MNTVLITGAGGFVGSRLALGLARLGFAPILTDADFGPETARSLAAFERLAGDVRALEPSFPFDYLIHGAAVTALPEHCGLSAAEHLALNVSLGLAALKLAQRARVKRLVFLSSAGVFSPRHNGPLDEDAVPDATGPYAAAKRMLELAALSLRAEGAVDAVNVRLGNLYGPAETPRPSRPRLSLVGRMMAEARREGRITVAAPAARREWTHADDLAPALCAVLTAETVMAGTLHLCSPETLTDLDLAHRVAGMLGAEVVVGDESGPAVRPPLQTRYPPDPNTWTPLADGLARALGRERVGA